MGELGLIVLLVALIGVGALLWGIFSRWGNRQRKELQARQAFREQRAELETQFFQAAVATGKPRGLRWKACEWEPQVEFARERKSGQLTALVGVTIQFEAV